MSETVSGVYSITNKYNNKLYIGSSKLISKRFNTHKSRLRRNTHENPHLQSAWNELGEDMFSFDIIITCHPDMCIIYEQQIIDSIHPEYNINKLASKPNPRIYTDSERLKVSMEHKGKIVSSETKKRMSESKKGIPLSDEHKKNLSISHMGNKSKKGAKLSENSREKISQALLGRKISDDVRKRMSNATTLWWKNRKEKEIQDA